MPVLVLEHFHSDGFEQCFLRKIQTFNYLQIKSKIYETNHFCPQRVFERDAVWLTEDEYSGLLQEQVNAHFKGFQCHFFVSKRNFRLIQPIALRVRLSNKIMLVKYNSSKIIVRQTSLWCTNSGQLKAKWSKFPKAMDGLRSGSQQWCTEKLSSSTKRHCLQSERSVRLESWPDGWHIPSRHCMQPSARDINLETHENNLMDHHQST